MNRVITISREFGSGGREIGFRLSEKLGIPFYDREIISMAAESSNIAEAAFHDNDERIAAQERVDHEYVTVNPFSSSYEIPVPDQLFLAQLRVIRQLARRGPCVIIGRCSDIIVENSFHVFICSSMKKRVERIKGMEPELTAKKVESRIREIDSKRRDYYQYYTGNEWGNPRAYDLCLNSGRLGVEGCVNMIAACVGLV
ncbi:MAG: cytidylate kinase-like family protein [Clostridiales bacterium]|nr:cytidylate kinase-like family protein [Clostridiales bacterium]